MDQNGKFFIGVTLRGPCAAVLAQPERGGGILVVSGFVDELSLPAVAEWCRQELIKYAGARYRSAAAGQGDAGLHGTFDDVGEKTYELADQLENICRLAWEKAFAGTRESRRQEIMLLLREGMEGEGQPRLGFEERRAEAVIDAASQIEDTKPNKSRDALIEALGLAVWAIQAELPYANDVSVIGSRFGERNG
jgi:hypothetical protein